MVIRRRGVAPYGILYILSRRTTVAASPSRDAGVDDVGVWRAACSISASSTSASDGVPVSRREPHLLGGPRVHRDLHEDPRHGSSSRSRELLADQKGTGFTRSLFEHPLISGWAIRHVRLKRIKTPALTAATALPFRHRRNLPRTFPRDSSPRPDWSRRPSSNALPYSAPPLSLETLRSAAAALDNDQRRAVLVGHRSRQRRHPEGRQASSRGSTGRWIASRRLVRAGRSSCCSWSGCSSPS